jgi:peroxiredoxin Q/BCP
MMHDKWILGFIAALCTSAVACQKTEPAATDSPDSVTQSAKPAESPATTGTAAPAAGTATAHADTAKPTTAATQLAVGEPAPPVTFKLQNGKSVNLASLQGKQVAVYFYPKDDTPGCTVEAQGIRDQWAAFEKAGIQVYGVSLQDAASHTAFIEKHKLPFDLVVDDGSVTKAFGVPVSGGEYASRHTFLIGADGKIKQIWREVTPSEHAKELLDAAGVSSAPGVTGEPKPG